MADLVRLLRQDQFGPRAGPVLDRPRLFLSEGLQHESLVAPARSLGADLPVQLIVLATGRVPTEPPPHCCPPNPAMINRMEPPASRRGRLLLLFALLTAIACILLFLWSNLLPSALPTNSGQVGQ